MMQAAEDNTSNLAEWWAIAIAVLALIISYLAYRRSGRIHREVNEPGWQVTVRDYFEVGAINGQAVNPDSGTEWRVENVGNVAGRNVIVKSRWGRRLQLPAAESQDLGTVEAGASRVIVMRSIGQREQAETTWPTRADYERAAQFARFRPLLPVRVEWTATTGRRRRRWASVLIKTGFTFRTGERPE